MNQLRLDFGQAMVKIARRYTRCHIKIERENAHLYFNHWYREEQLVPVALRVKPLFNTANARKLTKKQTRQNLNLRISNNHEVMNKELSMMIRLGSLVIHMSSKKLLKTSPSEPKKQPQEKLSKFERVTNKSCWSWEISVISIIMLLITIL